MRIQHFPKRGNRPKGEASTYYLGKLRQKLHEKMKKIGLGRGASRSLLCGSATDICNTVADPGYLKRWALATRGVAPVYCSANFPQKLHVGCASPPNSVNGSIWNRFSRRCTHPGSHFLLCSKQHSLTLHVFLPPTNEVWGKVICLQVCVCPQGGAWSWGLPSLGGAWSQGCLLPGESGPEGWLLLGGSGPRGVPGLGGVPGPGGSGPGGVPGGDPLRWLLLRAVRILLECILVVILCHISSILIFFLDLKNNIQIIY